MLPTESFEKSRKLILDSEYAGVRIIVLRGADVPTYVAYGAAEFGIVGKDVLMEYDGGGIYELLDLGIAQCRMVVAGPGTQPKVGRRVRVATKYVNSARRHFSDRGKQVEVIKLYGSMELAPLAGLADLIVDLVDTGNTLSANGLVVKENIADLSARLIVNKAAMKIRHDEIKPVVDLFKRTCRNG